MALPSTNGLKNGRFVAGNAGGPGNPHVHRVAKLRAAMLSAITEKDMRTITKTLVAMANAGDLKAIELLLNRVCGKPEEAKQQGPTVAIQNNQTTQCVSGRELALAVARRIQEERAEDAAMLDS
jgi:hypothetical protein